LKIENLKHGFGNVIRPYSLALNDKSSMVLVVNEKFS